MRLPFNRDPTAVQGVTATNSPTRNQLDTLDGLYEHYLDGGAVHGKWERYLTGSGGFKIVMTREVNFRLVGDALEPYYDDDGYELKLSDYFHEERNGTELDIALPARFRQQSPHMRLILSDTGDFYLVEMAADGLLTPEQAEARYDTKPVGLRVGGLICSLIDELARDGDNLKQNSSDILTRTQTKRMESIARKILYVNLEYGAADDQPLPLDAVRDVLMRAAAFSSEANPDRSDITSRHIDKDRRTTVIVREKLRSPTDKREREIVVETGFGNLKKPEVMKRILRFSRNRAVKPEFELTNKKDDKETTHVPARPASSGDFQSIIAAMMSADLESANWQE